MVQFAYNCAEHVFLGVSPVFVLLGYQPDLCMDVDVELEKSTPAVKKRAEKLIKIRKFLKSNLEKAKET